MSKNELKKLNIWQPLIDGITISTKEQLRKIIRNEYSLLLQKPGFTKLLDEAERHLDLIEELPQVNQLKWGHLTQLARKFGFSIQRVHKYLKYEFRPRLYWLLEKCNSKMMAGQRIANIYSELNGLRSFEELMARLETYYPFESLTKTKSFEKRIYHARKFFEVLQSLKNGGCFKDVARSTKVPNIIVWSWFTKGQKPDLVNLACKIPKERCKRGHRWLPIEIEVGGAFFPAAFIVVPLHATEWKQIQAVLDQLVPLENHQTKQWRTRFGAISTAEAFAYVLGLIVSDSRKETRFTSSRLDLSLSKKYDWSERVGEAFCYSLSQLGIPAHKANDTDKHNHRWQSRMCPLVTWMKQTCLGLQMNQTTSKTSIKATWLFKAPYHIRLRTLQGITDGDGYSSVKSQTLGIATSVNREFLQKLLTTFKIASLYSNSARSVIIRRNECILRASSLPFFYHAFDRQAIANKLSEMIRARKTQRRKLLPEPVITRIAQLRKRGTSIGAIIERIFDEFHISLSRGGVELLLRRRTT